MMPRLLIYGALVGCSMLAGLVASVTGWSVDAVIHVTGALVGVGLVVRHAEQDCR